MHAAGHAVSRQHRGARPREVIPKQIHHDDLIEPHARPSSEHADLLQWPDLGRADRIDRALPCGPGPRIEEYLAKVVPGVRGVDVKEIGP